MKKLTIILLFISTITIAQTSQQLQQQRENNRAMNQIFQQAQQMERQMLHHQRSMDRILQNSDQELRSTEVQATIVEKDIHGNVRSYSEIRSNGAMNQRSPQGNTIKTFDTFPKYVPYEKRPR